MPGTRPLARRRRASVLPVPFLYSTVSFPKSMTFSSNEQGADRVAVVDALDGLPEEAGDADDLDFLALLDGVGGRDGVGDEDLGERRLLDALERGPREDAVGGAGRHRARPLFHD